MNVLFSGSTPLFNLYLEACQVAYILSLAVFIVNTVVNADLRTNFGRTKNRHDALEMILVDTVT